MENDRKPKHIGRNFSRIRELRGMKQDALAFAMGVSQQTVSNIENSVTLDEGKLMQVAKGLGISVEAINGFSEDAVTNFFNSYYDNSSGPNFDCTFNPLDKVVELYERMLEMEKEKNTLLEEMLKK